MDVSDGELLARYRGGDVQALETLVVRHRAVLFAYALRMTRSLSEAEDVFQEVWLRVIRKSRLYRDRNFRGWLMRIAHNSVIDRARRQRPMVELDREGDGEAGEPLSARLAAPGPAPDRDVLERELQGRIRAAVNDLPPEQREVFLLRSQADLPFREIARVQRVSINTALARMQYALTKLRRAMADDYAQLADGLPATREAHP